MKARQIIVNNWKEPIKFNKKPQPKTLITKYSLINNWKLFLKYFLYLVCNQAMLELTR